MELYKTCCERDRARSGNKLCRDLIEFPRVSLLYINTSARKLCTWMDAVNWIIKYRSYITTRSGSVGN